MCIICENFRGIFNNNNKRLTSRWEKKKGIFLSFLSYLLRFLMHLFRLDITALKQAVKSVEKKKIVEEWIPYTKIHSVAQSRGLRDYGVQEILKGLRIRG